MRTGFSLVEVLVSVVLLSIGALGAAGAGELALRMSSRAALEERAALAAASVLDSLLAGPVPVAGEARANGLVLRWSVGAGSGGTRLIELHVESPGGGAGWTFAALHAPVPRRPEVAP